MSHDDIVYVNRGNSSSPFPRPRPLSALDPRAKSRAKGEHLGQMTPKRAWQALADMPGERLLEIVSQAPAMNGSWDESTLDTINGALEAADRRHLEGDAPRASRKAEPTPEPVPAPRRYPDPPDDAQLDQLARLYARNPVERELESRKAQRTRGVTQAVFGEQAPTDIEQAVMTALAKQRGRR